MNNNNKHLAKDIGILLLVWVPLLFIMIGGFIWLDGGFDGTIMENLFPALFFGFVTAFITIVIAGNLFRDYPIIWWISGIVLGIATVILQMCQAYNTVMVIMCACGVAACVLVVVKWIQKQAQ
jgi:hypothetical protein